MTIDEAGQAIGPRDGLGEAIELSPLEVAQLIRYFQVLQSWDIRQGLTATPVAVATNTPTGHDHENDHYSDAPTARRPIRPRVDEGPGT